GSCFAQPGETRTRKTKRKVACCRRQSIAYEERSARVGATQKNVVQYQPRSEYPTRSILSKNPLPQGAGKVSPMSIKLFAYMDGAPSLEEMRSPLAPLGWVSRHTLPADDR